jgi:hypothetical protein
MEKNSKVTQVIGNGTWNSPQYGLFYKFEIHMENGDTGEYMSKTQEQSKFVANKECTYNIEGKDYNGTTFYRIKPVEMAKPSFQSKPADPERELRIARMSVLKASTDLVINGIIKLEEIVKYSKFFEDYVMHGNDIVNTTPPKQDLPF